MGVTSLLDSEKFCLLEDAKYLYLREICEPRDNSLRLVLEEAAVNDTKVGSQLGTEEYLAQALRDTGIFDSAQPIESSATSRTFELFWKHYVAYLVTEECVGSRGSYTDEVYTGKLLRQYSTSHFLEHLARDTGGHTGPLQHYKLICLNHLIDVVSEEPPEIQIFNDQPRAGDSVQ
jgi:hypothetical protein